MMNTLLHPQLGQAPYWPDGPSPDPPRNPPPPSVLIGMSPDGVQRQRTAPRSTRHAVVKEFNWPNEDANPETAYDAPAVGGVGIASTGDRGGRDRLRLTTTSHGRCGGRIVQPSAHRIAARFQNMGVPHGPFHTRMAQEALNGADEGTKGSSAKSRSLRSGSTGQQVAEPDENQPTFSPALDRSHPRRHIPATGESMHKLVLALASLIPCPGCVGSGSNSGDKLQQDVIARQEVMAADIAAVRADNAAGRTAGVTASATVTYWLGLKAALRPRPIDPGAAAETIGHLPTLGVEPELVREGQLVVEQMRAASASIKSISAFEVFFRVSRPRFVEAEVLLSRAAIEQCQVVERMRPDLSARFGMEFPALDVPAP